MRTFIAIELPLEIKETLARLQEQLKKSGADVKWVKPDNIHLTLKFLGEIEDKKLSKLNQILQDTMKDKTGFTMRLSSIGAFPSINSPRVVWMGIDKGDSQIKEIAEDLEQGISKLGIPKEDRPFSSHITIGRLRTAQNRERLVKDLKDLKDLNKLNENLEFPVTKITLLKSTLTPKGPIYEVLKEAILKEISEKAP
jgi:2'-5' RNA ligase